MAGLACKACETNLPPGAAACMSCGKQQTKKRRIPVWAVVLGVLWLAGGIWAFPGGGLRKSIDQLLDKSIQDAGPELYVDIAADTLKKYEAAKRKGDYSETCANGMMLAEIYLRMKDEKNHKIWDDIQKFDCAGGNLK